MKNMNMTGSRCLSARQHLDAGTIISGRETAGGSAAECVGQWKVKLNWQFVLSCPVLSCPVLGVNIIFVFKKKTVNFFFTLLPLIGKMSDTFWLGYQVFRLGLWPTGHSLPWSVSLPSSLAYQSVFTSNEAGADHFSKCGDKSRGAAGASWQGAVHGADGIS